MPKTDITPSRRTVLGAAALLPLAALPAVAQASLPAIGADAELLAACARFHAADQEQRGILATMGTTPAAAPDAVHDEQWTELEAVGDRWHAALEAVTAQPAFTPAGISAKAAVLRVALAEAVVKGPGYSMADGEWHERLAWSLVNDMTGRMAA